MNYYVTLFGEFTVSCGNITLSEASKRSPKMWLLFEYLIYNRNKVNTTSEIINLLWDKGEDGSPGALKTLIYRLRRQLAVFEDGGEIIINDGNSYAINPKINIVTDVDRFLNIRKEFLEQHENPEKLRLCRQLIEIYKGRFLPKQREREKVNQIAEGFLTEFEKTVLAILEIPVGGLYEEVAALAQRAVIAAPESAALKNGLIQLLIKTGNQTVIRRGTGEADFVLPYREEQNETGGNPTLRRNTPAFAKTDGVSEAVAKLNEDSDAAGAMYCEFEYFQHLYRLESRYLERYERNVKFFLFTLCKTPQTQGREEEYMEHLGNSIATVLRISDVYTRYSHRQYAVMLYKLDEKFCNAIIDRVKSKFEECAGISNSVVACEYRGVSSINDN